ncbi:MAG: LytTR family transcriptional regulator [Bacteroidales bacterium]|nr:LytTR family transcriptional regulator [Bacteroidales bacterium]
MTEISHHHKGILVQVIFFLVIPLFFMGFMLLYEPMGAREFISAGRGLYAFNVTMMMCIALLSLVGTRLPFHFIWRNHSLHWLWYAVWCLGEIFVIACFHALYLYLMYKGGIPYFSVLARCFGLDLMTMIYPYVILLLAIEVKAQSESGLEESSDELVRFTDTYMRVKLVIAPSAILYIAAEENYVRISYMDGEILKDYVLRSSMKAIEQLVQKHGLVRCHRSYFINPKRIKVLRKDAEGQIVADLAIPTASKVPVSKRYYDALSDLL